MASPILKWAGGKSWLLPQLRKHVPPTYGKYIEPFVGGGALFFALEPSQAVLLDTNLELINVYEQVKNNLDKVLAALDKHVYTPEHYYHVRGLIPGTLDAPDRAARMIYLNKTCYNGLWRVNSEGHFNVPFGK